MINPNDLGEITESLPCIRIDDLLRQANIKFKKEFVKSSLSSSGFSLSLADSKTRFGGTRLWFICPICKQRKGVLYSKNKLLACRNCLHLKYKSQRYNKMIESNNYPTL